ncbi:MAG: leucyl aminopeptidase family protein [Gammaproteobacteria bacterium]|nr:MAG: leucyl aminopeptidase family protein [Gammaproteobacteria bacterium]
MHALLPNQDEPRLVQRPQGATRQTVDGLDQLIVALPPAPPADAWRQLPGGAALQAAARRQQKDAVLRGRLSNARGTGITLARLPADARCAFARQQFAGRLAAAALDERPASIGLLLPGFSADRAAALAQDLLLALLAQAFRLPAFPGKPPRQRRLRSIRLFGLGQRLSLDATLVGARAQNLARWLTALPANELTVGSYRELAAELAEQHGWRCRFLDEKRLRKLGAGAFLAVSQGNAQRDAGILRLSYRPARRAAPAQPLALIGKGILFDTGGNNLKPHKSMLDMHEDMAGSAVALATLQALSELEYPHAVDCWLALSENRASATACRPRDVIRACNGTTIEIIHTDAEGRLVLADTLALAGREGPALMLDYATLTGACVHALTERYSGVFSNRPALAEWLLASGRRCGERVWSFPMDADYDDDIKSRIADVKQCSENASGDHILAARFLQRFVPRSSAWAHVDLSAASRKDGLGHVPGGPTGFGVRLSLACLLDDPAALAQVLQPARA